MKKFLRHSLLAALLLLSFAACQKDDPTPVPDPAEYANTVALRWFGQFRELTKNSPGFSPPVASRAFGYAGITLYETVVPGSSEYKSLAGQLTSMPVMPKPESGVVYDWALAANAAMAQAARLYYANMPQAQKDAVTKLETELLAESSFDATVAERSAAYGRQVANAVFEWSKGDGGHEGYTRNSPTNYIPPVGPGLWVPTLPAFQGALQPFWGNNREFVPGCVNLSQPAAPTAFSTDKFSLFYQQQLEVYSTVKNIRPDQRTIALYWSDDPGVNGGTPPGHMISVTTIVLQKENASLMKAAEAYCKVGITLTDAFISCWKCKFTHNTLRPVSYIREHIDPEWKPLLNTPPFPDYISGHATQSGAAAQVLSDLFGYNYKFLDDTHAKRTDIDGSPRAFNSFFDMAAESSSSRLFGGIHIREANEIGVIMGRRIGEATGQLSFTR
jgi:PAP2 superfamily